MEYDASNVTGGCYKAAVFTMPSKNVPPMPNPWNVQRPSGRSLTRSEAGLKRLKRLAIQQQAKPEGRSLAPGQSLLIWRFFNNS